MRVHICKLTVDQQKKELQAFGTQEFPCAAFLSYYTNEPGSRIPWHWHDEFEIIYIASGELDAKISSMSYHLHEGDLIAINSGTLHFAESASRCELHSLVFHTNLITGNEESVFARKYISPLSSCGAFRAYQFDPVSEEKWIRSFTEAFQAFDQGFPGSEFTVREKLSAICCALYCHYKERGEIDTVKLHPDEMRVRKMLALIQENYSEPLTLSDIAKAADVGERECLRCFKKTIQNSPIQYLLKYRVMMGAAALLNDPAASISDIAVSCGFDSPSNFSKIFRRYYNCSPRQYRAISTKGQN